jgi:hypothetical protein
VATRLGYSFLGAVMSIRLALITCAVVLPACVHAQPIAPATMVDRQPDVPDGDLGCVVRLSIQGYGNAKILKDPKSTEAERKKAEVDDVYVNRDLAFYLGRIALRMPALPLSPTMSERINKALAEPEDQLRRETLACDAFQTRTKLDTYKLLSGR